MNEDIRPYSDGEEKKEPILRIWREIQAREQSDDSEEEAESDSSDESGLIHLQ